MPEITARVVPAKSREAGNTATHKRFTGGELVMTGANAASSLRSTPARFLVMDEIDAFPLDVEGEGDPIALAVQRTVTYRGRRKILMISTPTIKGFGRIEAAYLESDQRRFFVSCLHCAHAFTVAWKDIRWPKGKPEDAACVCPECGGVHEEREKSTLLRGGNWQATAPGDGRIRGYHLPALLSPFETWAEIAAEHGRVAADPARLKSWVNTKLGETWEEEAAQTVDSGALSRRVEHWGEGLPPGVAVITAGIDTQDEWLAVELVGWGAGEESWSLGWHRLYGDLTVMLPEGIGYGWDYQPGNLWERGLVPSALIDEGGGLIHVGRHAVQIDPPAPLQDLLDAAKPFSARPLPEAGLSDEDYVRAFLQPFGADIGSTVVGGLVSKLLTSVALSALQQALGPKPPQGGGLTISTTLRGEQNPETILLGRTATGGQAICPPYSHGKSNRYLTHVIEICSAPGAKLERLILNDDYVEIGTGA
ncbi:phage terminase large subunit GpA, partial [Gemmobacter caeni]